MEPEKKILGIPAIELFASGHTACAGCGLALTMRYALKAAGQNTIVVQGTGCGEVFSTEYPKTAFRVPWIHVAFENAAAVASGIEKAMIHQKKDYNILVMAGDGGTYDIGLQALSGMLERGHKICYVCLNNESYANTGLQRSGSTPKYANTTTTPAGSLIHGKIENKKRMPFIVAAHGDNVYFATASVAYPLDLITKIKKGLANNGPSFIDVDTTCTYGWKFDSSKTIEVAKLAVNSKVLPLYEIENGILKFTFKPKTTVPVSDYLKIQGRFKHLNENEIKEIQDKVDFDYDRLLKIEERKNLF